MLGYTTPVSKESLIFFIGLVVFLTPFLGIPNAWKEIVFSVAGLLIMLLAYILRRAAFLRSIDDGTERRSDAFVESMSRNGSDPTEEL